MLRRRQSIPAQSDEASNEPAEWPTPDAQALLVHAAQSLVQISRALEDLRGRVQRLEEQVGVSAQGREKPSKADLSDEELDEVRQTKARAKRAARLRQAHRSSSSAAGDDEDVGEA